MTIEIDNTIDIIVGAITIVSALIGTHLWLYKLGRKKADSDFKRIFRENRYKFIYAPLRKIMIDKHISVGNEVKYPYLKQRIQRANIDFKKLKIKSGFKKLRDKYGSKPFAGVDYGGSFPLDKIKETVENNIQWADNELVGLVQRAHRSKYEEHLRNYNNPSINDQLMTSEELELADLIFDNFHILNKKLNE